MVEEINFGMMEDLAVQSNRLTPIVIEVKSRTLPCNF